MMGLISKSGRDRCPERSIEEKPARWGQLPCLHFLLWIELHVLHAISHGSFHAKRFGASREQDEQGPSAAGP